MANKVVVHYADGRIERGYTSDFQPGRDVFHLVVKTDESEKSIPITISDLKAVFFVKELEGRGRASSQEKKDFDDFKNEKIVGKKVKVEFNDSEIICGLTLGYSPKRKGFFFTPIEKESNNERIFAILSSVKRITFYE
jgi:hypothetical protein